MTVFGRGLVFQPVLLACTYNDTHTKRDREGGVRNRRQKTPTPTVTPNINNNNNILSNAQLVR